MIIIPAWPARGHAGMIYFRVCKYSGVNSKFTILDKMKIEEPIMGKTVKTDTGMQFPFQDLQSFEVLFRQYYQMLCSYAYRFVNDPDTAEEIVQDLFYKLWEKREELQINTSVKSYLFSAVHNRCLKFIEHRNVETKYKNYYLMHESEIDSEPQHTADVHEMQEIIEQYARFTSRKMQQDFQTEPF